MSDEEAIQYGGRRLRVRSKNKRFSDETWLVSKDEDDFSRRKVYYASYNLPDKLKNPKFTEHEFVKEMNGYTFTLDYLDRNGFIWPVLVKNRHSAGLEVPDSKFGVNDVRRSVGSGRTVDVIDVHTQKDVQMSMKEYQKYYESQSKDNLYNVISLEFSHTKLDHCVVAPGVVRKLDWVDLYWPSSLKSKQLDPTNTMKNMMYPKVQKYCLMSVKGCYTDFHVDFGGTSVWYHILKGMKVFWLIPPTDDNLDLYRGWLLSDKRFDTGKCTFLGDLVDKCQRVVLKSGNTFFIPSGWLHAVYTPKDSLVFGGNFLHSYSIDMQIKISRVEDETRVTKRFRYPYFTEMHWYALNGIMKLLVHALELNSHHLNGFRDVDNVPKNSVEYKKCMNAIKTVRLLRGVKSILDYFNELPDARKGVPKHFPNHSTLLKDARFIYENYKALLDTHGISGTLFNVSRFLEKDSSLYDTCKRKSRVLDDDLNGQNLGVKKVKTIMVANGKIFKKNSFRRRRTRCRTCEACVKDDCGTCVYCKDMIKYGGYGRAKQSCIMRQCLQPVLPSNSVCIICKTGPAMDDRINEESLKMDENENHESNDIVKDIQVVISTTDCELPTSSTCVNEDNLLMECALCYEIVHPQCLFDTMSDCDSYDIANNINDDLPNSWKCPKCYAKKRGDVEFFNKQRFFKARSKVVCHPKHESNNDVKEMDVHNNGLSVSSQEDSPAQNI